MRKHDEQDRTDKIAGWVVKMWDEVGWQGLTSEKSGMRVRIRDGFRFRRGKLKCVKPVTRRYEAKTGGWGVGRTIDKSIPPSVDRKMRTEKS